MVLNLRIAFALASLALRLYLFSSGGKDFRLGIFIIALMIVGFLYLRNVEEMKHVLRDLRLRNSSGIKAN